MQKKKTCQKRKKKRYFVFIFVSFFDRFFFCLELSKPKVVEDPLKPVNVKMATGVVYDDSPLSKSKTKKRI